MLSYNVLGKVILNERNRSYHRIAVLQLLSWSVSRRYYYLRTCFTACAALPLFLSWGNDFNTLANLTIAIIHKEAGQLFCPTCSLSTNSFILNNSLLSVWSCDHSVKYGQSCDWPLSHSMFPSPYLLHGFQGLTYFSVDRQRLSQQQDSINKNQFQAKSNKKYSMHRHEPVYNTLKKSCRDVETCRYAQHQKFMTPKWTSRAHHSTFRGARRAPSRIQAGAREAHCASSLWTQCP